MPAIADPLTQRERDKQDEYQRVRQLARVAFRLTPCDCGKHVMFFARTGFRVHASGCAKYLAARRAWRSHDGIAFYLTPGDGDYDDLEQA